MAGYSWYPHIYSSEEDMDIDETNDDANLEVLIEELICYLVLYGLGLQYDRLFLKTPRRTSLRSGNMFINEMLSGHSIRCYENFRLRKDVFVMLCYDLSTHFGLAPTRRLSIYESVGIFLMTLAHGVGNRVIQETFQHSGETVSRHFHRVLQAVLRMSKIIIQPTSNNDGDCPSYIKENPRFYPYFKDCIGAIDGTHIKATISNDQMVKYIGRKGYPTQNIMAACDFNMLFTFVYAGWEGSAHDARVFFSALEDPAVKFPHPSGDKYYLVDAGYPNQFGYLAPYKGEDLRYHLPEFQNRHGTSRRNPTNMKEKFNYAHSSLRNVIERTFGVWKSRFFILKDFHPNFSFETQVRIVIASMAIHNYIRLKGQDKAFNIAEQDSYEGDMQLERSFDLDNIQRPVNDNIMNMKRDLIAQQLYFNQ